MRKIEIKNYEIVKGTKSSCKDVFLQMLGVSPTQGINIDSMRVRLKLIEKIEAAKDFIELKETEWEQLKQVSNIFPWGIICDGAVQLSDDLENAESVKEG